jgi:hypothetical protein
VAGLQHLLGLAMAVVLYALLRRHRAPRWAAALATAPLLLDAYQLQMEQTITPGAPFEAFILGGLTILLWPALEASAGDRVSQPEIWPMLEALLPEYPNFAGTPPISAPLGPAVPKNAATPPVDVRYCVIYMTMGTRCRRSCQLIGAPAAGLNIPTYEAVTVNGGEA